MTITVGILHALSGTMSLCESPLVHAAQLAIEEINQSGGVLGEEIVAEVVDGKSSVDHFATGAKQLIQEHGIRTIFGCWTSSSRKSVKPIVEAGNALLWYPVQYEGLEESPNIVYTGACLNQQIIPAIQWAMAQGYTRAVLIGSDYVFPRTANALIRALVTERGGEILDEKYIPLGEHDVNPLVSSILTNQPSIVFNTINGDSNLYLFRALQQAGLDAEKTRLMSFSLTEPELRVLHGEANGHYLCWSAYGDSSSEVISEFCERFRKRFGEDEALSDTMMTAYSQVYLWKNAVEKANSFEIDNLQEVLPQTTFTGPLGHLAIHKNHHVSRCVQIGKISPENIIPEWQSPGTIAPQPWLGVDSLKIQGRNMILESLRQFPDLLHAQAELRSSIEKQRLLELRLHESERLRMIGQLSGGIAHEFNNQLAIVTGFADMIMCKSADATMQQYAKNILVATTRATELTEKMLSFAQRGMFVNKLIDIHKVITGIIEYLNHTIAQDIRIIYSPPEESMLIRGGVELIDSALKNIAINACEAMPDGGTLTFTVDVVDVDNLNDDAMAQEIAAGSVVRVTIQDSGIGIDPAGLPQIFEPFFTTKEVGKASGMGLAAAAGSIKQHGGFIQVMSQPEEGSTFVIYLPDLPVAPPLAADTMST